MIFNRAELLNESLKQSANMLIKYYEHLLSGFREERLADVTRGSF